MEFQLDPLSANGLGRVQRVVTAVSGGSSSSGTTVSFATSEQVSTGTSTDLAISPDALAGSTYGTAIIELQVSDPNGSALTTGDGKAYWTVPAQMSGWDLVDADASVTTASSSGTPTVQVYNLTQTADMLSTAITIDANEYTSYTADVPPVIDTSNDDVVTGDILRIDVDVAGTGAKGLTVILCFRLP